MPKTDLGTKRTCPETGKNFYDLNKDPVVSPYTGKEYPVSFFEIESSKPLKPKRGAAKPKDPEEDDEDEDDELEDDELETSDVDDDEDEDEDETARELGDDADEVVLEGGDEEDESEATVSKVPAGFTEEGVEDDDDDVILEDDDDDFEIDVDDDIDLDDDEDEEILGGDDDKA